MKRDFMQIITSRSNPTVKKILSLQEKKYRAEYGEYLIEGEKMVNEAIACGLPITLVIASETYPKLESFEGFALLIVSVDVFSKISGEVNPQGIMATVALPKHKIEPPKNSCLLLDGVSDPGNMGTIIRTANAAGYEEIYLLGCTDPYAPKVVRSSMSGVFHTKIYRGSDEEILGALKDIPMVTADLNGENLFKFTPPKKYCLCIGNEGHGISQSVKNMATHTITIPMRSTQESLNAGVSAGIAMYLLKRKEFEA